MNKKVMGLFMGMAAGDALGLSREGLSPERARKLFGATIRPNLVVIPFIKRFNVCSDDTEHLWVTASALVETQDKDIAAFEKNLSKRMKCWVLSFPVGAGMATLKASVKLLIGYPPEKSGVFSAGNGAVMRAPAIGAYHANDPQKMALVLKVSSLMTHSDPKAYEGALVIAKAASLLMQHTLTTAPTDQFFDEVYPLLEGQELKQYLKTAKEYLHEKKSLDTYLAYLNCEKKGISGYVNHTVPAVVYAWLSYFGDYPKTLEALINAGGDTDTTAAIAGALAGITAGKEKVPPAWIGSIYNSPMSINKLEQLAKAFAQRDSNLIPELNFLLLFARNILLFFVILFHGFRRLLPPYLLRCTRSL